MSFLNSRTQQRETEKDRERARASILYKGTTPRWGAAYSWLNDEPQEVQDYYEDKPSGAIPTRKGAEPRLKDPNAPSFIRNLASDEQQETLTEGTLTQGMREAMPNPPGSYRGNIIPVIKGAGNERTLRRRDGSEQVVTPEYEFAVPGIVRDGLIGAAQWFDAAKAASEGKPWAIEEEGLLAPPLAGLGKSVAQTAAEIPRREAERLTRETDNLNRLYDQTLEPNDDGTVGGQGGQVQLTGDTRLSSLFNPKALKEAVMDEGSGILKPNGEIKLQDRFGLTKVVWKHGEKSPKAEGPDAWRAVTRDDILALPELMQRGKWRKEENNTENVIAWTLDKSMKLPNGQLRTVRYGVRRFTSDDNEDHVVTVHVLDQ